MGQDRVQNLDVCVCGGRDMDAPSLPGTGLQVLLADDSIRLQWVEEGKCRWSPRSSVFTELR